MKSRPAMLSRPECLDYDKLPLVMKALIFRTPYSGCFGTPLVIRYSFNSAQFIQNISAALTANEYITGIDALTLMSDYTRAAMTRAMNAWESVAEAKFVLDDHNPQLYLFNFKPPSEHFSKNGFARTLFGDPACIGINAYIADKLNSTRYYEVALHEVGHVLGLGHLFEKRIPFPKHYNLTTFSVMNYQPEYVRFSNHQNVTIETIGLMPIDMLAAQFIYGAKLNANTGDNVYYLRDYDPLSAAASTEHFFTINSLPWDNSGFDTLSAEGVTSPVVINIKSRGVSSVNYAYVMTPFMQIEGVVAGPTHNAVVLNEMNNLVDLRHAKRSLLFFSPEGIGHDLVVGFQPERDSIILETINVDVKSSWNYTCSLVVEGGIDSTVIEFSKTDKVTILGVRPDQFLNDTITTRYNPHFHVQNIKTNKYYNKQLQAAVNTANFDLSYPVLEICSMTIGAAVMMTTPKVVTLIMNKRNMSPLLTTCVAAATQCIPALVRGQFSTAGILVVSNAAFDAEYAMHLNVGIMLASLACESSSPVSFVTKVVGTALAAVGGYGLSMFACWGAKKIVDKCCSPSPSSSSTI